MLPCTAFLHAAMHHIIMITDKASETVSKSPIKHFLLQELPWSATGYWLREVWLWTKYIVWYSENYKSFLKRHMRIEDAPTLPGLCCCEDWSNNESPRPWFQILNFPFYLLFLCPFWQRIYYNYRFSLIKSHVPKTSISHVQTWIQICIWNPTAAC